MENQNERLISWALSEFKGNINFIEQKWNTFEKQFYYDFRTLINIENKVFEGRGISNNHSQAISISIGEALERFALEYNSINSSNGCAVHIDPEKAKMNSIRELIERHYVMLFTLGYYNNECVNHDSINLKISKIIDSLKAIKLEISFYKLMSSDSEAVVLCQLSGQNYINPFGLLFGSSCKSTVEEAAENSLKEILPNLMAFINNNLHSISLAEFKIIKNPRPSDHLALYLNYDFALRYLEERILKFYNDKKLNINYFHSSELGYPYSHICPAFKTIHQEVIEPEWGIINRSMIFNHNPSFPFVLP